MALMQVSREKGKRESYLKRRLLTKLERNAIGSVSMTVST